MFDLTFNRELKHQLRLRPERRNLSGMELAEHVAKLERRIFWLEVIIVILAGTLAGTFVGALVLFHG